MFKIISALTAVTTIIFVCLYFFGGKNGIYLTGAVISALAISVLQIAEIIINKAFTRKNPDNTKDGE